MTYSLFRLESTHIQTTTMNGFCTKPDCGFLQRVKVEWKAFLFSFPSSYSWLFLIMWFNNTKMYSRDRATSWIKTWDNLDTCLQLGTFQLTEQAMKNTLMVCCGGKDTYICQSEELLHFKSARDGSENISEKVFFPSSTDSFLGSPFELEFLKKILTRKIESVKWQNMKYRFYGLSRRVKRSQMFSLLLMRYQVL